MIVKGLKSGLTRSTRYQKGEKEVNSGDIGKYSREKLCGKMSELIEDIIFEKDNKKRNNETV